ncbi:MAG: CapA family protein [Clostridiaceae bacterium]|jgi:hypothetical protein|nr:CapA family protein [Clostridiaceae bacterium]
MSGYTNKHSVDNTCVGLVSTIDVLGKSGMAYAGTGKSLEQAAASIAETVLTRVATSQ